MAGNLSPLLNQVHSVPDSLEECLPTFTDAARTALPDEPRSSVWRSYVTGYCDSHQAPLGLEVETTIWSNQTAIKHLVESWGDARGFVFVSGAPNYGTALNSAAKLLGTPYFRDSSGGRSAEGGGGVSRILTSSLQDDSEL